MQPIPAEHLMDWHLLRLKYLGYTVVPNAIPPDLLAELRRRFDKLIADYQDISTSLAHPAAIDLNRIFELDSTFEELMDLPSVFPIAERVFEGEIALLGGAIGNYTPPHAAPRGAWHHDGKDYIRLTFFLSDLAEDGGPTAVLPGTHHSKVFPPPWANDDDGLPRKLPGMLPVTGPAGTCMINNTLIWHTGTPNRSDQSRCIIWVVYKHSSWDNAPQEHLRNTTAFIERQTNPRRRRLCGAE